MQHSLSSDEKYTLVGKREFQSFGACNLYPMAPCCTPPSLGTLPPAEGYRIITGKI
jgi:hypothetical protein